MLVLDFLKDNLNFIVSGVSVVAFITLLYFKFNKKHIPNLINKVTNVFAVIVSNLLGKSYEMVVILLVNFLSWIK